MLTADKIRLEVSQVLRSINNKPRYNLDKPTRTALRRLGRDESIIILPADKGNLTVVMDRDDYDRRINLVLSEGAYTKIPRDPTKKVEKLIHDNLGKLLRNKEIQEIYDSDWVPHTQLHHISMGYRRCTRQTLL